MPEYIEREALGIGKCNPDVFESKGYAEGWNSAIEIIMNAPAADVVEVKHGEWKPKHYEGGFMDGTNFEECSICRYRRYFDDIRFKLTFDYCPKCGAKMDGKEGVKSDL